MAQYNAMSREERIDRLRDKYLFDRERGLSTARAVLVTEAWKENLLLPPEIRRAKAYEHLLKNMPLYIVDEELIVGNLAEHPGDVNIYPEFGVNWILAELDRFSTRGTDPVQISEEQMEVLREILPWWQGKTVDDRVNELLPDSEKFYRDYGLVVHSLPSNSSGIGHGTVDFEKVLDRGIEDMIAEAQAYLDKLDFTVAQDYDKREFYRSVIITLNACLDYAQRFVDLAREKAAAEQDPARKAELEKIAEVCERVPRYPARTFHEALQCTWFVQAFGYLEQMGHGHAVGRPDQYLYKYYRQDIDNGTITQEDAQTLLESFWIKLNEPAPLAAEQMAALYAGFPTTEDLMVGGVKVEDGTDATNELSHMMLDADYDVSLIMPEFAVYVHKNADHEFLKHAAKLVRKGTGKPKFVNVECLQNLYTTQGIPYTQEELNDIMLGGCGETILPKVERSGFDVAGYENLPLLLELVLYNGVGKITGAKIGVETGDPRTFETFDQLLDAYKKQCEAMVRHSVIARNAIDMAHAQVCPTPFMSSVIYDCMGRGLDITRGGAKYSNDGAGYVGVGSLCDELAAIEKCVYEDKSVTMDELIRAMDANFEGEENERIQKLLLAAPKYGNDDDYADKFASTAAVWAAQEYGKYRNMHGGTHTCSLTSVTSGILLGGFVGASPDGRKACEPLNEGGVSPYQGRDKNGPTAVLKSVSKVPMVYPARGDVLNIKFSTKALKGDDGLENLVDFLRAFNSLGLFHVQFNCIDTETLLDAQAHPENYKGMMIRVAAYTAYFTQLTKQVQDEIIKRTVNEFG